jgi:hypothetical protein
MADRRKSLMTMWNQALILIGWRRDPTPSTLSRGCQVLAWILLVATDIGTTTVLSRWF